MTTRDTVLDPLGLARLEAKLQALVGLPLSVAHLSYGEELRIGLGALRRSRRGYMNAEWTIGTRGSPWSLELRGKAAASERDDEHTWAASLERLKGHRVKRVTVSVPGPDLSVEVEGGYRFVILASKQPEWQAWELFFPDGSTLVAWSDGHWVERPRGEESDGD